MGVSVWLSCWADRIGRGGVSPYYVLISRCSLSDQSKKLSCSHRRHDWPAVMTAWPVIWLKRFVGDMRSCPGSRYICQPTLGCGVFPYPFGRTVRCASSDICSSIALTVIAVLQRLDMFSRGADKSLALPWKKTICSEQYLQQYTKPYGVQKAGIYSCCL